MKISVRLAVAAAVLVVGMGMAGDGFAAGRKKKPKVNPKLAKVCKRIVPIGYHQLYKAEASGHLAGTIYANSCSFICGKGSSTPPVGWIPIYDKKGHFLSSFQRYSWEIGTEYNARFYTLSPSCATIATTAYQKTRSAEGYLGIGNRTCIKVNNLFGREGSVF